MEVTVALQTNFMLFVIKGKLDITFKMTKWQLQPKRVLLLYRLVLYHLLMMLHGTSTNPGDDLIHGILDALFKGVRPVLFSNIVLTFPKHY